MPRLIESGIKSPIDLDADTGLFELSALELVIIICVIWYFAYKGNLGTKAQNLTAQYLGRDPATRVMAYFSKSS
jgi:hypothetical protein